MTDRDYYLATLLVVTEQDYYLATLLVVTEQEKGGHTGPPLRTAHRNDGENNE
jgi:hypothetical protein